MIGRYAARPRHPRPRHRFLALVWLAVLAGLSGAGLALATAPAAAASGQGAVTSTAVAAWAQVPGAVPATDRMASFAAGFALEPDGGVRVTETISYTFDTSGGARRGILRAITVRQQVADQPGMFRAYAISDWSASSPTGAPAQITMEDKGGIAVLRIGDPNRTVSGTQTYVLSYRLGKVANAFPDTQTAEFYYNVFKDDQVPKSSVELKVTGPDGAGAAEVRCGRGPDGAPCQRASAGVPALFSVTNLAADEDLTIAVRYPLSVFRGDLSPDLRRGTVDGGALMDETPAKALVFATLAGGVLAPLVALIGMGALVATRGRDEWYAGLTPGLTPGVRPLPPPGTPAGPDAWSDGGSDGAGTLGGIPGASVTRSQPGTIAVQFTPPAGVGPGLVGTVIDESADTVDVSATVVDLAVRGYLRIEEIEGGGVFSRTDWQLTALTPDPAAVGPLRPYEQALLNGLFESGSPVLLSQLKNHFAQTLGSVKNLMYDEVLQRHWFRRSPDSQRGAWRALGFLLVGAGAVLAFFYGNSSHRSTDLAAGLSLPIGSGWVLGLGIVLAGVVVLVLGGRMAAKTAEGSAVLAQSLGFRRYLETAEANQIRWEEAQEIFSRFLPYAIVFGVADRWAGVFQQVAANAAAAGQVILMPNWYVYHGSSFPDFDSITSAVDAFATAASGTLAATPGSSGGSGFGSSGGGFSGGGVGGSSSGSW